jgi:hypothetical protein
VWAAFVNAFQIGEENAHAVDAVGDRLVRRSAQPGCDVGGQNDGQQRFGAGGLTFQVALGTLQQQKRIDDQDRDNQNRIDHRLKRDIGHEARVARDRNALLRCIEEDD